MAPDTGTVLYTQERYAEAIQEFQRANEARPSAAFEFNIGRSYDRLGQWREAIAGYERYLAMASQAPDAAEVRARIELLRKRLPAAPAPKPDIAPQPSPPIIKETTSLAPPASSRSLSIVAPSVVAGIFAFSAIGAGTLYGVVDRDVNRLASGCAPSCDAGEVDALRRRETASFALFGIAGAALIADVALWTVWAKQRPRRGSPR